jgi:hypothetical protein
MGCRRKRKVESATNSFHWSGLTLRLDFEQVLVELGAVKDSDPRLSKQDDDSEAPSKSRGLKAAKKPQYEDDNDWE